MITDMLGKSTRIFPSLALSSCVACCVAGAPGVAGWVVVVQLVQEGGFGSAIAHRVARSPRRNTGGATIGYWDNPCGAC